MLGLRREFADRHVLDHAPAQRAHCLVGHGDAPVLSEGCEPLISRQDAPLRYRLGCVASPGAIPRERFSPLALRRHPVMSAFVPVLGAKRISVCNATILQRSPKAIHPARTVTNSLAGPGWGGVGRIGRAMTLLSSSV